MRLPRLHINNRVLAILALGFLAAAGVFLFQAQRPQTYRLRMAGGDALGRRHQLALLLAQKAARRGLLIRVLPEDGGSGEVFRKVQIGELDIGLIQGGEQAAPGVMQIAALHVEPLHLLVKKERADKGLSGLRGRRVNLNARQSGTRRLALQVLSFAGLESGRDFADEDRTYGDLEKLPYAKLPDAVFMASTMPAPIAEFLVRRHGYKFVALPFGAALSLRDATVAPTVIPMYSYSAAPPSPERDMPTVGNRLLLVAGDKVEAEAVQRLLDVLFTSAFLREANIPAVEENSLAVGPQMPLHPGAVAYVNRDSPYFNAANIQSLESLRNFLASLAVALFFGIRWFRRRRYSRFDSYIGEVALLERQALALEMRPQVDLSELLKIRIRLSEVKTEALEKFARGELNGEELMSGFLTHVADVRGFLTSLILSERGRIAARSSDNLADAEQEARFQEQWSEAVGDAREVAENLLPPASFPTTTYRLPPTT